MGCADDKRLRQLSLFDQEGVRGVDKPTSGNGIQVWQKAEWTVRSIWHKGEWWWVAADVCRCLGVVNVTQAVDRLDDEEKNTLCLTEGDRRKSNVVNESGLYELIIRSDKPEAKAFRRWIKREVLPSIRKTGKYDPSAPKDDSIDREAMRLRSDRATAEARLENRKNNCELAAAAKQAGAKDPREYARIHDEGHLGITGKTASVLRRELGIGKRGTPLDHADGLVLRIMDLAKGVALKLQEVTPNPTPEALAENYGRATREIRDSTLHQLDNNPEGVRFGVGIEQDPRLGKVIAVSPLALTDDR